MNDTRAAAPGENAQIADLLRETAQLLEAQGANPFRVSAYRNAAAEIARLPESVRGIFDERGVAGLEALPHVGRGIAAAIAEMLITGRWSQLERLRGTVDAVQLFRTVPGIGPGLAERIHDELHLDTLEALEVAANDGRLEAVAGVGPRRAAAIRAALENMLRRKRVPMPVAPAPARGPEIVLLLEVDRDYRDKADAGKLPTIAPRRLNPEGKSWLPVLHAHHGGWHFTALYSNTAQAHRLGKVRDWVVIYFYDHDHAEGQHTVVTETRGPLAGRRVVRGREPECKEHYAAFDFSAADKRK
ncbi:MAG: DNA-binding protein [Betaproteobacteria bacterium]|nr:MAG: DNA-binding protein [Betaproteobacteria bacterium SG8_41]UCF75927.1 MAG: DNA-binding protein [Betaproteobacteria bacterium]